MHETDLVMVTLCYTCLGLEEGGGGGGGVRLNVISDFPSSITSL